MVLYYHCCKQFITFITSHLFPQQQMYIILKGHAALEPAGGPDAGDASDLPCDNERVDIVAALVRVHSLHVTERLHQFSALITHICDTHDTTNTQELHRSMTYLAHVEIGDDAIAAKELPAERHRLPCLLRNPCLQHRPIAS